MPKKKDKTSSRTAAKQAKKIVEDKTFGLKNKKKSKKVQQFVQSVTKQVKNEFQQRKTKEQLKKEAETRKRKEEKKKADAAAKELAALLGADPSLLKAAKKKQAEERAALEAQQAEAEAAAAAAAAGGGSLKPLRNRKKIVYAEKEAHVGRRAQRKARDKQAAIDDADEPEEEEMSIEEIVEQQRQALDGASLVPVTKATFEEWQERRKAAERAAIEAKIASATAKGKKGANVYEGLSGREIYISNSDLFVDDDGAGDDADYAERGDEEGDGEGTPSTSTAAAAAAAVPAAASASAPPAPTEAVVVDESLFAGGGGGEEDDLDDLDDLDDE